jgi:hypothetical protein
MRKGLMLRREMTINTMYGHTAPVHNVHGLFPTCFNMRMYMTHHTRLVGRKIIGGKIRPDYGGCSKEKSGKEENASSLLSGSSFAHTAPFYSFRKYHFI